MIEKASSFSVPIRINWDLSHFDIDEISNFSTQKKSLLHKIVNELLINRVLLLSISGWEVFSSSAFHDLISLLKKETKISLIHDFNYPIEIKTDFLNKNIETFILQIEDINLLNGSNIANLLKKLKIGVAFQFTVTEKNYRDLPAAFNFCLKNGIKKIILPNANLAGKRASEIQDLILSSSLKKKLAGLIGENNDLLNEQIALDVYDPSLWRLLNTNNKETKMLFQGCQAANSVAFIDSSANVYPCLSLPLKLGNLKQNTLKEIWASKKRLKVKQAIEQIPQECQICSAVKECAGGCRGITYSLKGDFNFAEPSCIATN